MNQENKMGCLYSWPVIILALIFFWPIGIFLIIQRVSHDKQTAISGGKTVGVMSIVLFILGIFMLIGGLGAGLPGPILLAIFLIVAGFVLRKKSKNIIKESENIKQYLAIVVNGNVRQLDAIASSTGKPYDVVRNDLQNMINKGFLKNAYINEGARELVLPTSQSANSASTQNEASPPANARTVTCQCCGANNTIISGGNNFCEFCGAALN